MNAVEREVALIMRTIRWGGTGRIEAVADQVEAHAPMHIRGASHARAVAQELRTCARMVAALQTRSG